jgi:hypothetical protein
MDAAWKRPEPLPAGSIVASVLKAAANSCAAPLAARTGAAQGDLPAAAVRAGSFAVVATAGSAAAAALVDLLPVAVQTAVAVPVDPPPPVG